MARKWIVVVLAVAAADARGHAMTAEDWSTIEAQLLRAYRLLKAGVGEPR